MVGVNVYWDYFLPESSDHTDLDLPTDDDDDFALESLLHAYFPDCWCAFNASLLSSVAEVRPLHAAFSHRQENNGLDTFVHWQVSDKHETATLAISLTIL